MTGIKLKLYACASMLLYTIGMTVIRNGLLKTGQYSTAELNELLASDSGKMVLAGWASAFQLIGGLAVPIFAFLLVEGFRHTSSYRNYLLSLLGFAVLSEVPYDLAMSQEPLDWSAQNPLFTLAVCLIMLYGLRMFEGHKGVQLRLVQLLIIIAALLWCAICRLNFGLCTVLLTAVYYLLRDRRGARILLGCLISLMYITGPLSGYPLWAYNGERGWNGNKYLFYLLYPAHLLVLAAITSLL